MTGTTRGIVSLLFLAALGSPDPGIGQIPGDRWTEAALTFIRSLRDGRFEEAAARVSDAIPAGALGAEQLAQIWNQLTASSGPLIDLVPQSVLAQGTLQVVDVAARFERQPLTIRVVLTPELELTGLWFLPPAPPPYEPPDYVDKSSFDEVEVTIGAAPWKLAGTLTVPNAAGPHAIVVLVHGSGPHDRDETIGPNRPFRDLAWGLASMGVAVLRYEKRTKAYANSIDTAGFTVEQEVIEDALAALEVARNHPGIDGSRVFLAGHSLGGMLAPAIAERDRRTAGVILMAAPARPIEEVLVDQLEYIAALPQSDEAVRASIAATIDTIAKLRAKELPPALNVMGAPVSYYYDLATFDPVGTARRLDLPILLLHGDRDYQVTQRDLAEWKGALANGAVIRAFPSLNHLFMEGTGQATPTEYFSKAGHVARVVLEQIAEWIGSQR